MHWEVSVPLIYLACNLVMRLDGSCVSNCRSGASESHVSTASLLGSTAEPQHHLALLHGSAIAESALV